MTGAPSRFDVVVIGAGAAGAAAALAVARQGLRTAVVDARADASRLFRAEKLEPQQLAAAERLGALAHFEAAGAPIPDVVDARNGAVLSHQPRPQLGLRYEGIAGVLARAWPLGVHRITARVAAVVPGEHGAEVRLAGSSPIHARLVVLASGASTGVAASLGIETRTVEDYRSTTYGFDVRRTDGADFPHAALTVYPESAPRSRAAYVSFFAVPGATRANLFSYLDPTSDAGRDVRRDPLAFIRDAFPRIEALTGPLDVVGRIDVGVIELRQAVDPVRPSVVLVGDAFQTVCPSTGTGLDKAFSDAETLGALAPTWLADGAAAGLRVAELYGHAGKRRVDRASLDSARYHRRLTLDTSWRMRLHRERTYLEMRLGHTRIGERLQAAASVAAWIASFAEM